MGLEGYGVLDTELADFNRRIQAPGLGVIS